MAGKKQDVMQPSAADVSAMSATEAVNELQRAARLLKAFEHAERVCSLLANIEQLTAERQRAADAALSAADKASATAAVKAAELTALMARCDAAKATAERAESAAMEQVAAELRRLRERAAEQATEFERQRQRELDELTALRAQVEAARHELADAERALKSFRDQARAALKSL